MGTFLLITYAFLLAAVLLLIFIKGTKGKNQKILDEMDKKQQELLLLQLEVKDMLLLLDSSMEESKEQLENERNKVEFLIDSFQQMMEESGQKMQPKKEPAPDTKPAKTVTKKPPEKDKKGKKQYELVAKLQREGKSLDEIASELKLSKGEAKFYLNLSSEKNL